MTIDVHSADLVMGMSRAEWLAERRKGIGGSDAAAIVGLDPWSSPFTVWLDKTEGGDDDRATEAMEWGTLLEPIIAHYWTQKTGKRLIRPSRLLAHPDHPWMLASLDRFVLDDNGVEEAVWEGKTANAFTERDWDFDNGNVPERVVVQAQHYLAVSGLPICHLGVLVGGQQFRSAVIERDEQLIADLIHVEERFWIDHVLANVPPPIDGHQATTEAVRNLWPESTPELEVDLPYDANRLIIDYRAAEARIKAAEEEKDAAANQLRALLGDAEVGRIDGMKAVTWKSQTAANLDRKALREAHPDLCEQFTTQNTTRVLRLVKGYQP